MSMRPPPTPAAFWLPLIGPVPDLACESPQFATVVVLRLVRGPALPRKGRGSSSKTRERVDLCPIGGLFYSRAPASRQPASRDGLSILQRLRRACSFARLFPPTTP